MKHKTLRTKHFIFLLVCAAFIVAMSFASHLEVAGHNLNRAELWEKGFGVVTVILGLLLGVSSFLAWQGSTYAFKLCQYWAGIYTIIIMGMIIWNFPNTPYLYYILGFVWAFGWGFFIRGWHIHV